MASPSGRSTFKAVHGKNRARALQSTKPSAAFLAVVDAETNVETFQDVVQLSGLLNSRADINRAVVVARDISGESFIKNDMWLKWARIANYRSSSWESQRY